MLSLPSDLKEHWQWFGAIWAWDYGDGRPLGRLIVEHEGRIPKQFADAVSQIVVGGRSRQLKAAVKSAIPASEFAAIAGYALLAEELRDALLKETLSPMSDKKGAKAIAEYKGLKPIEVVKSQQHNAREMLRKLAEKFNTEVETIERLRRECKRRIEKWPVV